MFIKGWNAVLLSKKAPILIGFFGSDFGGGGVKSETVNLVLYYEAVRIT